MPKNHDHIASVSQNEQEYSREELRYISGRKLGSTAIKFFDHNLAGGQLRVVEVNDEPYGPKKIQAIKKIKSNTF